jgi:hypothetical protein
VPKSRQKQIPAKTLITGKLDIQANHVSSGPQKRGSKMEVKNLPINGAEIILQTGAEK